MGYLGGVYVARAQDAPTPTATSTASATVTATEENQGVSAPAVLTPTQTPTSTPTRIESSPTLTNTTSALPTATTTSAASPSASPTSSSTPTLTATFFATQTPTTIPTATPTGTPSQTQTAGPTSTPSATTLEDQEPELLAAGFCGTVSEIPPLECEALLALYEATSGADWLDNTGWLEIDTPCSWFGVTCQDGHVSGIVLPENHLVGELPTELGSLSGLSILDLQKNQLSGEIPGELGNLIIKDEDGNLSGLQHLDLSSNRLGGSFPTGLGNLQNLKILDLSDNLVSGNLPTTIGYLISLELLYLANNKLEGEVPNEITNLFNLRETLLVGNNFQFSNPSVYDFLADIEIEWDSLISSTTPQELVEDEILHLSENDIPPLPRLWLPGEGGKQWMFTQGPHPAPPATPSSRAYSAVDFGPNTDTKCSSPALSNWWVVAAAWGKVTTVESSWIIIDHDGDGNENSGWQTLYQHVANQQVSEGDFVNVGTRLGNPSCDGIPSDEENPGKHVHFAIMYQGSYMYPNWKIHDGTVLSGWEIGYDEAADKSSYSKDDVTKGVEEEISSDTFEIKCNLKANNDPNIDSRYCDVPRTDTFYENIFAMWVREVTDGCLTIEGEDYKYKLFCPDHFLRRDHAMKFLGRAFAGIDEPMGPYQQKYDDVPYANQFHNWIAYFSTIIIDYEENGDPIYIVQGYPDGLFHPDDFVTRGQWAKMIVNTMDWRGVTCSKTGEYSEEKFHNAISDVRPGATFYNEIWCLWELMDKYKEKSIGYKDGNFKSDEFITRAESSKWSMLGVAVVENLNQEPSEGNNNEAFITALNTALDIAHVSFDLSAPSSDFLDNIYLAVPWDDQDWVKLDVRSTGNYIFSTQENGINADIKLEIFDTTASNLVASSVGYSRDGGTILQWTPDATGTYYLKATNVFDYAWDGTQFYLRVQNGTYTSPTQAQYVYRVDDGSYLCGNTGLEETQGIVAMQIAPSTSEHEFGVSMQKCDGSAFGQPGDWQFWIDLNGDKNIDSTDSLLGGGRYNSGNPPVINQDFDPVGIGHYGPHYYMVKAFSDDDHDKAKHTGIALAWEEYQVPSGSHGQVYQVSPTSHICGSTITGKFVADDANHKIKVYIARCDGGSFGDSGKAYVYVDNVPRWGPFSYSAGGAEKYLGVIDPFALGFSGNHIYKVVVYSDNDPAKGNKYSGNISVWDVGQPTQPSLPGNVQASDSTYQDHVRVSWNNVVGATHYEIWRNTTNSTTGATQLSNYDQGTPFDDYSAAQDTSYYYWVKACNDYGCSSFSNPDAGRRSSIPPTQAQYVYRMDEDDYLCGDTGLAETQEIVAMQLRPEDNDQEFEVRMQKCDDGSFGQSGDWEFWIDMNSDQQFDNSDAILRDGGYSSGNTTVIRKDFDPVGIGYYGPYYYMVKAYSDDDHDKAKHTGIIMAWEEYQVTSISHTQVYQVSPTNHICGSTITGKFVADDANHNIKVYIAKCDGGSFNDSGKAYVYVDNVPRWGPFSYSAGGTEKYLGRIDPYSLGYTGSHTYKVVVYSNNDPAKGNKYSGIISVLNIGPPNPPSNLQASDGAYENRVQVSWNNVSGATRYEVWRNTTNITTGATQLTDSDDSSPFDDSSVSLGNSYYYWVKACNNLGCSGFGSSDVGYADVIVLPPANDDIENATQIDEFPFAVTVDTGGATKDVADPILRDCNLTAGLSTVWYQYSPSEPGTLTVDTRGSNYDTILSVWSGSPGNLTLEACNDDISLDPHDDNSEISIALSAGNTYYIEAAEYEDLLVSGVAQKELMSADANAFSGGKLDLSVDYEITCFSLATSLNLENGGHIEFDPAPNCDNGSKYYDGTQISLTAVPTSDYFRFLNWGGNADGSANPFHITMTADNTITANFEQSTFTDVPFNHPRWAYIEALWDGGYTAGCQTDPLLYCPDTILNRAMSAVFMLRAHLGTGYTPPSEQRDTFADDWSTGLWAKQWAEGMWREGLTAGCNTAPMLYCPWDLLPRVQASVFGVRMKRGVDFVPAQASGKTLADMPDVNFWGCPWAEQAYLDELLPECGRQDDKPLYCPNDLVNRAWAAYMIVKAKNLPLPP